MANQFHSRLKESELHRPERTGSGDPNGLSLSAVRDGQYYQDIVTGSLYRYNLSRDHWDLLIDYDADNQVILNSLSQASVTSGSGLTKIGKINAFIGTEQDNVGLQEVIRVFADLYVGLNEGAEIIIQDEASPLQTLSLTVEEDINAGENVTIKVQGDKTSNNFPVGSIILADAKQQEALFSVDPSKVLLQLQNTNGNLASLEIDVDEISSEIVLKTDAQGNIAQFRLDSDQVESSISLNADQIDVQGKTTFTSALVNEGIETQSGAQSKASEARVLAINTSLEAIATDLGYDDFQSMTINAQQGKTIIDGGFLRTSLIQVDNLFAQNALVSGSLTVGTNTETGIQGLIKSDGFASGVQGFQINANGNAEFQDVVIGGNTSTIGNNAKLEDLSISGELTINNNGLIQSDGFLSGSNGFQINADGSAEFNNVVVRSSNFSNLDSGFELTGNEIKLNKQVTIGGQDSAVFFDMRNPLIGTQSADAGGNGNNLARRHQPLASIASTTTRSNSYFFRHQDHEKFDGFGFDTGNELGSHLFFGFYDEGPPVTTLIQASGDGDFTFDVEGDIECVTLTETSDKYLKENIEPLGSTLDRIVQLEGKTFDMIGASAQRKMGLLAQDVEPLFPEAVGVGHGENEEGERIEYKTLSYTQLIPALIESIKELNQKLDERSNTP